MKQFSGFGGKLKAFSPRQITNPHSPLHGPECVYVKMIRELPSRQPLIICYFLCPFWFLCVYVRGCMCVCVRDWDIPAAETREGVTYETLDSALSGD